ncbi:hypothetical protein ACEQPO_07845 [Bacillus sp. SL00103]
MQSREIKISVVKRLLEARQMNIEHPMVTQINSFWLSKRLLEGVKRRAMVMKRKTMKTNKKPA